MNCAASTVNLACEETQGILPPDDASHVCAHKLQRRDRVSQDFSSSPPDKGDALFSPSDYFLGIVQRITASGTNTRITLPGRGEVSVFPQRKEFSADIPDMADFFQAPAAQFEVAALDASATPQAPLWGKHIGELLWQAGFHASQGRLVEGTSKYDVVEFRHWPNLSRLSKTANTARICALLTRHPTTIMLVHRQLDIGREEVYRVYSAAHCAGIANMVSRNPQATAMDGMGQNLEDEPARNRGLLRSLFAKISGL